MGIKRLGRKRLHAIEKLAILKDISAGDAMKNAIVSATQHREGQKLITDIVLDLGSSDVTLLTKATSAGLAVSDAENKGHICQITDAVFGIVTSVETICLEAISDGTLTNFDLTHGTIASGGTVGVAPSGTPTSVKEDIGTLAQHETVAYDAQELQNRYLFLTSGAATTQKASATIDCTDATPGNITDGVDTIRLIDSGESPVLFVAESDTAYNAGSPQANKFNIGSMTTAAHLATSLAEGINHNGAFTAEVTDSTKVTVTHATSTATSNHQAGYLLNDDPQAQNGISIGAFTGGIDDGQAISSGKLLIRVTGFVAFDDVS